MGAFSTKLPHMSLNETFMLLVCYQSVKLQAAIDNMASFLKAIIIGRYITNPTRSATRNLFMRISLFALQCTRAVGIPVTIALACITWASRRTSRTPKILQ